MTRGRRLRSDHQELVDEILAMEPLDVLTVMPEKGEKMQNLRRYIHYYLAALAASKHYRTLLFRDKLYLVRLA